MRSKFKNWLTGRPSAETAPPRVTARRAPIKAPELVEVDNDQSGAFRSPAPGNNVPARRKFVREDTGTHETLKIFDDSIIDTVQDDGADPYNTGGFDRSKSWDKRFSSK